jgi:hypothetical protein
MLCIEARDKEKPALAGAAMRTCCARRALGLKLGARRAVAAVAAGQDGVLERGRELLLTAAMQGDGGAGLRLLLPAVVAAGHGDEWWRWMDALVW